MKKIFALLLVFLGMFAGAQTVPTTPNLGLYTPYHGTANWDTYTNSNFTALDNYLSGSLQLQRINLGQLLLTQYLDYTGLGSAPANPASGICRVYFDLGTGQWKGINSTGASCSPSGNASGTTGAVMFYAASGTVGSPSLCTIDVSGNLTCTSFISSGIGTAKFDLPEGANPGNPVAGKLRFYADSTSHKMTCLTSAGATCWNINWGEIGGTLGSQSDLNSALSAKAPVASPTFSGTVTFPVEATTANCASSGGTCAAAPAGRVSIAAAATTVTVATTAVTANSEIMVTEDATLGTALSVTCNTTAGRTYAITARTAGTSFVITSNAAPVTNPACLNYRIVN